MIKNIIIVALLLVVFTGVKSEQALDYVQLALDKSQEVLYYIQESVKNEQ
jgi:hypothetical protein